MTVRTLRTLIVDDERLARVGLRRQLEVLEGVDLVGECAGGEEAVRAIEELEPDLVLLDIQMPGMGGFDVVRRVGPAAMPPVVFVTAYDEFALEAFEVDAVDYVLKPIDPDRFRSALTRVRKRIRGESRGDLEARLGRLLARLESGAGERAGGAEAGPRGGLRRLIVRKGGRVLLLDAADVDWIESAGNYARLHVGSDAYLLRRTTRELERELDPRAFLRIHRSVIVNMERVSHLKSTRDGRYACVLKDGTRLESSRRRRAAVEAFLDRG